MFNRRRFLIGAILSAPFLALADSRLIEPKWIKVRHIRLGNSRRTRRFIHITDIHHKGDRGYLQGMVNQINQLSPDFVCFTGDLIEEGEHLAEALELLTGIKSPIYGVPGNHDYWSKAPFDGISKCFAATGGGWMLDQTLVTADETFTLIGASSRSFKHAPLQPNASTRNIFLMHYPAWVENLAAQRYDLILAGHSHGGQVRIPPVGAVILPYAVGRYDLGMFQTPSGPLYVNPGIGWFPVPIRFNCRPEITVFEM
jgi:uncharacterized protein